MRMGLARDGETGQPSDGIGVTTTMASMISTRNRAVFVAAINGDVVGYSRLLADDFDATSEAMVSARTIVEDNLTEVGGTLVNFVGDNFMAVLPTAVESVQAAIAITTAVEASNAGRPEPKWLRFRLGIDQGYVSITDGHYEGDVLNIAARIQALCQPGGLAVSGAVYRALDEPELRFRTMGTHRLKNIPEPVPVYDFVGLPSDAAAVPGHTFLGLDRPSVAVLPVIIEGASPEVGSAAGVIRSDIVHRLTAVPGVDMVEALGSDYRDKAPSRYVLETGVLQFGDDVRVYANLLDLTTMNVVKSHRETSKASDLLTLSDRLAEAVANTVAVELIVGAPAGIYAELGDAESIHDVYLGWYHLKLNTRQGWEEAYRLFQRVADQHPELPTGLVLSAFTNWMGVEDGFVTNRDEVLALARDQARIASEMGDPTGLATAVDAAVLLSLGHTDEAAARIDGINIVRPTCDVTYALEGSLRRYLGDWEEAVDLLDVAMRLSVVSNPWYPTIKACSLFIGERVEQAAAIAEAVLEHQPTNVEAMLVLAASQVELGMDRRALATADRIRETFPTLDAEAWIDGNPYKDDAIRNRWKDDLRKVELVAPS